MLNKSQGNGGIGAGLQLVDPRRQGPGLKPGGVDSLFQIQETAYHQPAIGIVNKPGHPGCGSGRDPDIDVFACRNRPGAMHGKFIF